MVYCLNQYSFFSYVGNQGLSSYTVKGLKSTMENYTADNIESKGVKAHFNLDDNGLLSVTAVEAAFEQTISVEQQIKEEEEKKAKEDKKDGEDPKAEEGDDTWSKTFGDSISSFFGGKLSYQLIRNIGMIFSPLPVI